MSRARTHTSSASKAPCQSRPPVQAADQSDQLVEMYQVLVDCPSETAQRSLLERLTKEGLSCQALIC